jgi:hypothetical protein
MLRLSFKLESHVKQQESGEQHGKVLWKHLQGDPVWCTHTRHKGPRRSAEYSAMLLAPWSTLFSHRPTAISFTGMLVC